MQDSRTGSHESMSFSVPSDAIRVTYHYDCALKGRSGGFTASLVGVDTLYSQLLVHAAGVAGSKRGSVTVSPGPGAYYVKVNSDCAWQVSVEVAA